MSDLNDIYREVGEIKGSVTALTKLMDDHIHQSSEARDDIKDEVRRVEAVFIERNNAMVLSHKDLRQEFSKHRAEYAADKAALRKIQGGIKWSLAVGASAAGIFIVLWEFLKGGHGGS